MPTKYEFLKTCALDRLTVEIRGSSIVTALDHMDGTENLTDVYFKAGLSDEDLASLTGLIAAHEAVPLPNNEPLPKDPEEVPFTRIKATAFGWTFQDHVFEFTPALIGGVFSKNAAGVDFGYTKVKFYEGEPFAETLIVGDHATDQAYITANCTATLTDWEPTWHFDVFAGELRFYDAVTQDVRLWAIVAPDVPEAAGGSKEILTGGRNLRYVKPCEPIILDGRVTKRMNYSATFHSNKFRFLLRHPLGFVTPIETCIQLYRA